MNITFTPDYSVYKKTPALAFRARENVDVNCVNKNLFELRQNNFINGVYDDTFFPSIDFEKNTIKSYSMNPKYKDYDSELFDNYRENKSPYMFAAIVNNMVKSGKDTRIVRDTPDIFKGLKKDEVFKSLDTLSYLIRDKKEKEQSIKIGDKTISLDYIGEGGNSAVYKLSDDEGNVAAMKTYFKPEQVNSLSLFGELAIYQGIKDANINNVPALYMANPISTKVEDKTKEWVIQDIDNIKDYDGYKGGWTVVEFITPKTPKKEGGISLHEWLKTKGLFHLDATCDNCIGNYIIDLGGIST